MGFAGEMEEGGKQESKVGKADLPLRAKPALESQSVECAHRVPTREPAGMIPTYIGNELPNVEDPDSVGDE